jgi:hypothetical protein
LAGDPDSCRLAKKLEKSHLLEYVDARMHPIVPVITVSGHIALQALASGSSAISAEAQALRDAAIAAVRSVERSQALFGRKAEALSRLAALAAECAERGWDGEAGEAIHPLAALWAERFVRVLPDNVSLPEFAPEPDGAISLDWIVSRNRLFSLSVGRTAGWHLPGWTEQMLATVSRGSMARIFHSASCKASRI